MKQTVVEFGFYQSAFFKTKYTHQSTKENLPPKHLPFFFLISNKLKHTKIIIIIYQGQY